MSMNSPMAAGNDSNQHLPCLDANLQVQVLLAEYNRLSAEIKMFIEQFSPKLSVFGIFVLSAFAFAFSNRDYPLVFAIIPLFIYLLGFVTIAQAHVIAVQAGRIRAIEHRVNSMNGEVPLLEWESKIAPKFVYPPVVKVQFRGSGGHKISMVSPILMSVLFLLGSMAPLLVYSTKRTFEVFPPPWNWAYVALVAVSFVMAAMQSFTFFRMGGLSGRVEFAANELE